MIYGEIQAIVQLAVALNVGLYTLKELSLPFIRRQQKDLSSLRLALGEAQQSVSVIEDRGTRERKILAIGAIAGRIATAVNESTILRRELVRFLKLMNWSSGILAGVSIILLFFTAHYYKSEAENYIIFIIYFCYITIPIGVIINLYARRRGAGLLEKQNNIYQELARII